MVAISTAPRTYNYLDIGHPDNPKPWAICGAHRSSELGRGKLCMMRAGMGTAHVGVGRCKYHGGNMPSGTANGNYKHGLYSRVLTGPLGDIYNQVSASRKDNPLELWEELNVQRTLLIVALVKLQGGSLRGLSGQDIMTLAAGGLSQATADGAETDTDKDSVVKAGVGGVVGLGGSKVSSLSAPNPAVKPLGGGMVAVAEEQLNIVRDLINDIVGTSQKITQMINQDRLTSAEIVFTLGVLREVINEFIPDADKQRAFVNRLRERIPGVVKRSEGEGTA